VKILTDVLWSALAAVGIALTLLTYRRSAAVASPGALLGALTRRPVGRVVVLLCWMWLGWHLFAR
jgi:hypothetical protein